MTDKCGLDSGPKPAANHGYRLFRGLDAASDFFGKERTMKSVTVWTLIGFLLLVGLICVVPARAAEEKPSPTPPSGFDAAHEGVPRGNVETVEYDSKSVGTERKMVIYTPPGYTKDSKYPVLYLLHGTVRTRRPGPAKVRKPPSSTTCMPTRKSYP